MATARRMMATTRSATMMVRHCACVDGACTCVTRPFGDDRPHLDTVAAASPDRVIELPSALYRALTRAGITRSAGPGDTLSEEQIATLLSGKSISERIEMKQLADIAGILPRASR
jgi:hypothetical protein